MKTLIDLLVVGAGPAGLMAARCAAELGLKVTLVEKKQDFTKLRRACSAQFIMDNGYERECLRLADGKLKFPRNHFEINYSGTLVELQNKYYHSPNGHRIHFTNADQKPFAYKFDKRKLLEDLYNECTALGVEILMSTLACGGEDMGDHVRMDLRTNEKRHTLEAKKVIIAEGVNANLTGILGLNTNRTLYATAHVVKYILEGITDYEPHSWNLYYGKTYHSNAPVIIGPSLYGDDTVELTISGSANLRPDSIFENLKKDSPLKNKFAHTRVIDKQGCAVKAFGALKEPYKGNILVIGDSAAFVEVEVQGALMCGFRAADAILSELEGDDGFELYKHWWNNSFEFNHGEFLQVSQGYALVPTYTDDEINYLFTLIESNTLEGTYSQYKTPKIIWDSILLKTEQIKIERPEIYEKICKMHQMTLTSTF